MPEMKSGLINRNQQKRDGINWR